MTQADEIRAFVFQHYIVPAHNAGNRTVRIRAGDVHKQMKFSDKMPAVCGAIGAIKFEDQYKVKQVDRVGPTNGANVFFTFEI